MKNATINLKQALRYAFAGLLGITLLSSCKKDDPYDFEDTIAAEVNLINASVDAGATQLYVDDVLRTPNVVNYGEASGYNKAFVGDQDIQVRSSGSTLTTSNVDLSAFAKYTFFLVGTNSAPGLVTVIDDTTAPAAGKAKIRFVNASPNATSATLTSATSVLAGPQNFRGAAPSTEVTAGAYALSIVSGNSRSNTSNVNLESGRIYTIYAKGNVGGTGAAAFAVGVFVNN